MWGGRIIVALLVVLTAAAAVEEMDRQSATTEAGSGPSDELYSSFQQGMRWTPEGPGGPQGSGQPDGLQQPNPGPNVPQPSEPPRGGGTDESGTDGGRDLLERYGDGSPDRQQGRADEPTDLFERYGGADEQDPPDSYAPHQFAPPPGNRLTPRPAWQNYDHLDVEQM